MTFINGIDHCIREGRLLSLLSCCVYQPDSSKLDAIVDRYNTEDSLRMLGCSMEGRLAGCAGIDSGHTGKAVLLHLAVDPAYRGQGIGRKMINELMEQYDIGCLEAETDGDAVGFYRNCGFVIEELGEKYPGVFRYKCSLAAAPWVANCVVAK